MNKIILTAIIILVCFSAFSNPIVSSDVPSTVTIFSEIILAPTNTPAVRVLGVDSSGNVTTNTTVTATVATTNLVVTTNGIASASGQFGEVIQSVIILASPTVITSGNSVAITQITVTPGDWDISGDVTFAYSGATVTASSEAQINTTGAISANGLECYADVLGTIFTQNNTITIPAQQWNTTAANTTLNLFAKVTFTAGSVNGYGVIRARRVR